MADVFERVLGAGNGGGRAFPTGQYAALVAGTGSGPFKHVISLGPRCTHNSSVYKKQRAYAAPFDWIFSSAAMVIDCLRDSFATFLDTESLFEVSKSFDAVGLPPGSAPRERTLVGHRRYSDMTEGVGRGVIFNHHNPLTDEGYAYIERCVWRFLRVLEINERKLYTFICIDRKLWKPKDILTLFDELVRFDKGSFVMLAVHCVKHCGDRAKQSEPIELERQENGRSTLQMLQVDCVGENTGSYFRDEFDAKRIQAMLVEPFRFALVGDPLKTVEEPSSGQPSASQEVQSRRSGGWRRRGENDALHGGPCSESAVTATSIPTPSDSGYPVSEVSAQNQPVGDDASEEVPTRRGRWSRKR
eukprot:TRINITY_DN76600_c0_g1_i1.p1 TRINITY_DN76600_c0_g1~~TRINITY_DN76600_c0_g1_i1.p1  ORF type:complete len:374 (-),score=33.47 TRINITY_DN76600_c0_g1_i1:243-1319(-)